MYKEIKFVDVKPFVRYSRLVDTRDYRTFNSEICASDARLFYCIDGVGKFEIGETTYSVKNGSLIILPQGTPYTFKPDKKDPMLFIAFNFDYTWENSDKPTPIPPVKSEKFDIACILSPVRFLDTVQLNTPLFIERMNAVSALIHEIDNEYKNREAMFELRCSSLLICVLTRAILAANTFGESQRSNNVSIRLIDYIKNNYKEKITLEELGNIFGYHPNYLNELFRKHTGKTIYNYLQEHRTNEAIHLLQSTDTPIGEIAVLVGLNDISHFSKTFKKITGFIPSDFRV